MEEQIRDAIVFGTWALLSVYSSAANVLLILLICSNTDLRKLTSYWIVVSFSACDIGMTIISLCHFTPSVLLDNASSRIEVELDFYMLFYNLFWYTEIVHIALMAPNRFVFIVHPLYYKKLFDKRNTALILCSAYLLGFTISSPTMFPACYILWDSQHYMSLFADPNTWYIYVDMGVNVAVVSAAIIFYSSILYTIRKTRRISQQASRAGNTSQRIDKVETRLLAQFIAASVIYVLTWTTWLWLPHVSTSIWMSFLITSFFPLNNAANPTVYLIFNKSLRQKLTSVLNRQSQGSSVVVMTL